MKAKEDFIGGNAIDTNKEAYIAVKDPSGNEGKQNFDTPTVNVRLLDMNEMHSEVTVYLGDLINEEGNAPIDSLKYFWDNTRFTKLVAGDKNVVEDDVQNKVPVNAQIGLTESSFYLKYALGEALSKEDWLTMVKGKLVDGEMVYEVVREYTYDNASSHGPVGYFTFSLEKVQPETDKLKPLNPDDPYGTYGVHHAVDACPSNEGHDPKAGAVCEHPIAGHTTNGECTDRCGETCSHMRDVDCDKPVEKYILNITYTAYKLNEYVDGVRKRPKENVHNGSANDITNIYSSTYSPGTQVGTGTTLPTGKGKITKENIHEVHVIQGEIRIIKKIQDTPSDEDQHFTFNLHRVENGSSEFDEQRTITIPAGSMEGETTFIGLYRGTYVITEVEEADSEYKLSDIEILDSTNCENRLIFDDTTKSVTFVMGHNVGTKDKDPENVISKVKHELETKDENGNVECDGYTSYTDPVNGVYGEVRFTNSTGVVLPVTGAAGTYMYVFGGLLLTAAALIYGYTLRRRNRKEAKT